MIIAATAGCQPAACLATCFVTAPRSGCINDHYGRCGLTARTLFGHMPRHSTPVWVHCVATAGCQPAPRLPVTAPWFGCIMIIMAAAGRQPASCLAVTAARFGRVMIIVATAGCQPAACLATCLVTAPRSGCIDDHYGRCGLTARTLFGHMPRHSTPVWVHCVATAGCQPAPRLPVTAPWFGCIMIIIRCGPPARILFGRHGSPVWTRHDHCGHCGLPARSLFGHIPRHSTPSGCINDHYGRCGLTASTLFGHPVTAPWFGCIMIIMAAAGRQPASCLAVTAARFGRVMIIVATAGCQPAACLATCLVTAPRSGCINDHYGRCGLTASTLFGHMPRPRHSTPVWVHCVTTAGCQPAPRLPVTAPWFGCIMIIMAAVGRQPASCLAVTAARFGRVMIIVTTAGCQPAACLATFLVTAPRSGCINDHYGRCGLTARTRFGHMPRHSTPVWVHCVATAGCQPAPRLPVTAPWFGCIVIIMAAAGRQPASCLAVTAARFGRVMIIVATAGCQPAACLATFLVTAPRSGCINLIIMAAAG